MSFPAPAVGTSSPSFPEVVPFAPVGSGVDRVVAGVRELAAAAGGVAGGRVVAVAVLARVAEEDERRARTSAGVRDQVVVAAAAVDDGDRAGDGAVDREGVVVPAEE